MNGSKARANGGKNEKEERDGKGKDLSSFVKVDVTGGPDDNRLARGNLRVDSNGDRSSGEGGGIDDYDGSGDEGKHKEGES